MGDYSALVTGGRGFIGSRLVKKLLALGWDVESFDLLEDQDVLNLDSLMQAIEGKSVVFHLAARHLLQSLRDPIFDSEVNVLGTLQVLCAASDNRVPVVMASSGSVIGEDGLPSSPHGISKLCCEKYGEWFRNYESLPVAIMRYFSVYGPGMPVKDRGVIGIWLKALKHGQGIKVEGGCQERSFVYVDDVVDANLLVAEALLGLYQVDPAIGRKYNLGGLFEVGTSDRISMGDLAQLLMTKFGRGSKEITVVKPRMGDSSRAFADTEEISNLGWRARVGFTEGLKRTNDWLQSCG